VTAQPSAPPAPSNARALPATARPLRAWQAAALAEYERRSPRDFLAVATPGAGKTAFALRLAADLLARRVVQAVTVVTPTEHLKAQWAEAAAGAGIALDPTFRNAAGAASADFHGVVVTYAQVAMAPLLHRRRTEARRTLVVFDEIHHAGDALSWGDGVREAFEPATRRLGLTGTPFRSDTNPIPFVSYVRGRDGVTRSAADSTYGYADALRDGVVRPVLFLAYSGQTRWRTSAGDEVSATLGEPLTEDVIARAWRTALDPGGEWVPEVLSSADRRLTQVRASGMPDAGGLVIASDHKSARAYAAILRERTGEAPVVVLSDDPRASGKIAAFSRSTDRWMVAVRMVSEGVDVPRLAVGVYATSVSTPLFFAQAVGRFVRARRRGEIASVFLPSVPVLLSLAAQMEVERDHALDAPKEGDDPFAEEDALLARARESRDGPAEDPLTFEALEASAHLDRLIFDGDEFGGGHPDDPAEPLGDDDQDFLGLPGLLEPAQVATLLRQREAEKAAARAARLAGPTVPAPQAVRPEPVVPHQVLASLRRELNGLVAAHHHRTGRSHGSIHAEVRRACGGPASAQATAEQLRARIALVRRWG
jgi:superfamily II DNA or RNA helicase